MKFRTFSGVSEFQKKLKITSGFVAGASMTPVFLLCAFFLSSCDAEDGIYRAGQKGGYYFVDSSGKKISPGQLFDEIGDNSCGEPRPVKDRNGKWGYATRSGVVLEPKFNFVTCFNEDGYSMVEVANETGILKRDLTWEKKPADKLELNPIAKKGRLLHTENLFSDSSPYYRYGNLSSGLIPISTKSRSGQWLYGYVDESGDLVYPIKMQYAGEFRGGLARVALPGLGFGYMAPDGTLAIPMNFSEAYNFSDGLAAVKTMTGRSYGFIDKAGKWVVEPKYQDAGVFADGYSRVKVGDRWGFIDKKGDIKISAKYESVESFYKGLSRVQENGRFSYINKSGDTVFSE